MKFIIQAGGLGSRLKHLTSTKPKGLVSAKYLPIIFHLFKKYPDDDFIIIGDYKFDVLDRYLATFARDVNYVLLKSNHKGNVAGIRKALDFISDNEPFAIIWSDIILSSEFRIFNITEGCQVGIADFDCSWSFVAGRLAPQKEAQAGVGGLFVFSSKKWLEGLPEEGSLTEWLRRSDVPMSPISLMGSIDVGTMEAYQNVAPVLNRCRPYNEIEFRGENVIKKGLTPAAEKLIGHEVEWYRKVAEYGFSNIPEIRGVSPLTMEHIKGVNVFLMEDSPQKRKDALHAIVSSLLKLHSCARAKADYFDLYREYFSKTIERLAGIITAIPFGYRDIIRINNRDCLNIFNYPHILRDAVLSTLMQTFYVPIHGDCQFTNTLIGNNGKIYFIDARGYFGNSKVLGDPRYDWAKIYYSLAGNFDQFNIKNFQLKFDTDSVEFSIGSGGWEWLEADFMGLLPGEECRPVEIELIHAIIWLSLASHAWEDFDSMCIAFYNGLLLFNQWQEKYGKQH